MNIHLYGYIYDENNNKKPYGIVTNIMPEITVSTDNLVIVEHNGNYVYLPIGPVAKDSL